MVQLTTVMILSFWTWANSADPDQTAPRGEQSDLGGGAVWSGSALFAISSASFRRISLK